MYLSVQVFKIRIQGKKKKGKFEMNLYFSLPSCNYFLVIVGTFGLRKDSWKKEASNFSFFIKLQFESSIILWQEFVRWLTYSIKLPFFVPKFNQVFLRFLSRNILTNMDRKDYIFRLLKNGIEVFAQFWKEGHWCCR